MTELDNIRARWIGADWQYRERRLTNGRIGSVGIETLDGLPVASSPFEDDKNIFETLGNAPRDILKLLSIIDELTK